MPTWHVLLHLRECRGCWQLRAPQHAHNLRRLDVAEEPDERGGGAERACQPEERAFLPWAWVSSICECLSTMGACVKVRGNIEGGWVGGVEYPDGQQKRAGQSGPASQKRTCGFHEHAHESKRGGLGGGGGAFLTGD